MVEYESFRHFLKYINPEANRLLPRPYNTIRRDLAVAVRLRIPVISKSLSKARSEIHFVYDGWTSSNGLAFLGVIRRFLDANYHLQSLLLGLPQLTDRHSGEIQANMLFQVTEKYNCTDSMGYVISDNTSTMDTMAEYLEIRLQAAGIDWTAAASRVRCLRHIIHLSAHDFFFLKQAHQIAGDDDDLPVP